MLHLFLKVAGYGPVERGWRELGRVAQRVAICMWGVEEVEMFAAIDRTARIIGGSYAERGARRYRTPRVNPRRVVLLIAVDRVLGHA